ncbi:MAG: EAL domain-containing protein, partial [Dechloromonas sp.]|nr:EAL domain-containing protein [Dechloromonas sp.]
DSMISLAHKLGKTVVAEGVESIDQLMHLKTVSCDELQGYYFSRPVPPELAKSFLIRRNLTPGS